ncbi:MAG TPA: four helix bundle protein [Gemmatimonadaceae bacterium]|nr:four helix bundle protein [Gemmatimonadaceae bacterium]
MTDFRKLEVWNRAHALALNVHRVAMRLRGAEYLTLRSQMIRAAGSIDANIVEGSSQKSDAQFVRFLNIAVNSANELESHLIMAFDLRVMSQTDYVMLPTKPASDLRVVNLCLQSRYLLSFR